MRLVYLLIVLLVCVPAAAAQLSSDKFANVFVEDERVVVTASQAAEVSLTDITGQTLKTLSADKTADFGLMPPGYYEAVSGDTKLPIVVLIDPQKRVKGDSAAVIDNAMSWLVPVEDLRDMARLLRLAGMSWVRERISWGDVANEDGSFDFSKYVLSADALSEEGVKVYQVFHDSPQWARADGQSLAVPDDLRVAYDFGKAFAAEFRGKVFAWEFWNEPDIGFFYHPSSECAALQKAIYLGSKSVDPSLRILGPSMAMTGRFESNLLANDAGWYMDTWNYHIYAQPEQYKERADHFLDVMAKHGHAFPMWLTEAGDPFVQGDDGVLSGPRLAHQARFASRAYPHGIASGVERFFYFVFPFYREGRQGWGLFGPSNKYPYPALAAVSNAAYALGQAKYLGTVDTDSDNRRILAFDRGDGTRCIAAWQNTETPSQIQLPLEWEKVIDARDYLGTPIPRSTGPVSVQVGDNAVFFIVKPADAKLNFVKPTSPPTPTKRAKPELTNIVPRIVFPKSITFLSQIKTADAYLADPMNRVDLIAEVYNFGNKEAVGEIIFTAVSNCTVSTKSVKCNIAPGGRCTTPFAVRLIKPGEDASVSIRFKSGANTSTVALLSLAPDPDLLTVVTELSIKSDTVQDWEENIVEGATQQILAEEEGGVRFVSEFPVGVDRWSYPQTVKVPSLNIGGFDALQFEYKTDPESRGQIRAMVVLEDDSYYITAALPPSEEWKQSTLLLRDAYRFTDGKKNPDLSKAVQIRIGCNSEDYKFTLSVRNIKAVKLRM